MQGITVEAGHVVHISPMLDQQHNQIIEALISCKVDGPPVIEAFAVDFGGVTVLALGEYLEGLVVESVAAVAEQDFVVALDLQPELLPGVLLVDF